MPGRWKNDLNWSDVTPKATYLNRRQVMVGAGALAIGSIAAPGMAGIDTVPSGYSTDEVPNTLEEITAYNNFYEFGTGKEDPADNAHMLTTDPWSVEIDGLVDKPGRYDLADLLSGVTMEERIYRFRCVEAWSMVIPWVGFELADLAGPGRRAAIGEIRRLRNRWCGRKRCRAQRYPILEWPYREGLRLDEAMHPLTITGDRALRRADAEPERRAAAAGGAVEVRLQVDQVDRADLAGRGAAADRRWNMLQPQRIRVLFAT